MRISSLLHKVILLSTVGKTNTQIINAKIAELGETGRASQMCVVLNIGGINFFEKFRFREILTYS